MSIKILPYHTIICMYDRQQSPSLALSIYCDGRSAGTVVVTLTEVVHLCIHDISTMNTLPSSNTIKDSSGLYSNV